MQLRKEKKNYREATILPSDGRVQIEATFAPDWEKQQRVGVSLNTLDADETQRGYEFSLFAVPPLKGKQRVPQALRAVEKELQSFESIRGQDGHFLLLIQRDGRVLFQHEIHHSSIHPGPLTIRAERDRNQLSVQIGSLPVHAFRDPFPLASSRAGRFGLIWPNGTGIVALRIGRKLQPVVVSALEKGDGLYDSERFAEALTYYQQQVRQTDDVEFRQEAEFKQAMCLLQLNRSDEAAKRFSDLLSQPQQHWPPLAGCQLWLMHLRDKQRDEANAVYDVLSIRFRFADIAALIPDSVRREILAAYDSDFKSIATVLKYNPDLVRDMQRLAAVDRFLSADGRGNVYTQLEVTRAYRMMGDLENALMLSEQISKQTDIITVVRHHTRLLRMTGQPERAQRYLNSVFQRNPSLTESHEMELRFERARLAAALENWTECEQILDEAYRIHRSSHPISPDLLTYLALMKGFLLDHQGARPQAEAVWREAYQAMRPALRTYNSAARSDAINMMILGSLSGDLQRDDAQLFFGKLVANGNANPMISMAQAIVSAESIAKSFREMWRTPRGRKYAEGFAFETLTLPERVKIPLVLAAVAYLGQTAFQGELTTEQDELLFESGSQLFDGFFVEGTFTPAHAAQLSLTWRGTTNLLGWAGVAPTLAPRFRAPVAYILAHRYLRMTQPAQAVTFFNTAIEDAEPDSVLAVLARTDLDLFNRSQGRLEISGDLIQPTRVRVMQGKKEMDLLEISPAETTTLNLPTGSFTLEIATEDESGDELRLSDETVRISPASRRVVKLQRLWTTESRAEPLYGIIPHPSTRVAGRRWQAVPRDPHGWQQQVAWSPDGKQIALGDMQGVIRLMDAATLQTTGMLIGHHYGITDLQWSPDGGCLASSSWDRTVRFWDPIKLRALHKLRTTNRQVTCLAWSHDSQRLAAGGQMSSMLVWTRDGNLDTEVKGSHSQTSAISWNRNRTQLAAACTADSDSHFVGVWNIPEGTQTQTLGDNQSNNSTVAWSADGLRLAAGGANHATVFRLTDRWLADPAERTNRDRILHIRWLPDKPQLAVASVGGQLRVWDTSKPSTDPMHEAEFASIQAMDISPAGRLAVWHGDGRLTVAQPDGTSRSTAKFARTEVVAMERVDDGRVAVATQDGTVRILSSDGDWIDFSTRTDRRVYCMKYSQASQKLACIYGGLAEIDLFDLNGTLVSTLQPQDVSHASSIAWNPTGQLLLVGDHAGEALILDIDSQRVVRTLAGHERGVSHVDWSIDGRMATSDLTGQVRVWHGERPSQVELLATSSRNRDMRFSPNGTWLLVIDHANSVRLFDRDESEGPEFPKSWGDSFATFTTSEKYILVPRQYHEARVWTIDGTLVSRLMNHVGRVMGFVSLNQSEEFLPAAKTADC